MDQPPTDPTPVETYEEAAATLKPRQRKFVEAYLQHFNGSRAAREVGVSEASCRVQAHDWLTNPNIQRVVELGMQRHGMGKYEVLARQQAIARATIEDFISIRKFIGFEEKLLPAVEALDAIRDEMAILMDELDSASEERAEEIKQELKHYRREELKADRACKRDPSTKIRVGLERVETWAQEIDLKKAEERGVLHLLKSAKKTADGGLQITLYDSQKALEWFGDHYGLTSKSVKLGDPDGKPLAPGTVLILPSNGRD
ncbi:terminase small subunit [Deinococcus cellulosilyticus]|uniref:Terminase small subunit n=1 Tax=Deinococcus cellulosilyticus (strain DSM 18568 / NBRC 106333 / KACC 11606 / 5516J-15) TaxID=1223518 RepID=A0A511N2X5_DEIC1|nr:terminase small subunit [Deinococcus cellulosilyticus]GEM47199.1 hypothetical protein DC3_28340 [Deinococcus cellulosilyticus NBRC 106333 = KACC 11606]